jgi:hypothetical protein
MTSNKKIIDRVTIVPNVLDPELCKKIIENTEFPIGSYLTEAQHYDIKILSRGDNDAYDKLIKVFDDWTNIYNPSIPYRWIMVMRYQDGKGTITRHKDTYNQSNEIEKETYSLMFYLNDVQDGGETRFFTEKGEWDIKPTAGTLVIIPGDVEHEARIPLGQEKFIALSRHN